MTWMTGWGQNTPPPPARVVLYNAPLTTVDSTGSFDGAEFSPPPSPRIQHGIAAVSDTLISLHDDPPLVSKNIDPKILDIKEEEEGSCLNFFTWLLSPITCFWHWLLG
jgi:hypothetical protein